MNKQQKVKLLEEVLNGKTVNQALKHEEIGPLLIQMSEDEYYSPLLVRTLTGAELRSKLSEAEISERVQITFIIPHNNR